ncbi:hypothetical protein TIFTF001_008968 [Ficus carica]|uniref:Uncharacterized protein n=1 Tax=Ficus carica TaxID=3494 RepID=A0AA88A5X6_FICCA|nr:hypothetical protein TIFTF001_008968 [Ficus carica]
MGGGLVEGCRRGRFTVVGSQRRRRRSGWPEGRGVGGSPRSGWKEGLVVVGWGGQRLLAIAGGRVGSRLPGRQDLAVGASSEDGGLGGRVGSRLPGRQDLAVGASSEDGGLGREHREGGGGDGFVRVVGGAVAAPAGLGQRGSGLC